MLATSARSSALPFPSVRFFLNFFLAVADGLVRLSPGTAHSGRFYAVAFTPPTTSCPLSYGRLVFFDNSLRPGVDKRRVASIGRRTRTGGRRCGRRRTRISLCLFGNVLQSAEVGFAPFHHRLMDIGSADTPRSPMQRLRVGKDFDATRATLAADQLWRRLATGHWPQHCDGPSGIFLHFKKDSRPIGSTGFKSGVDRRIAPFSANQPFLDRPHKVPLVAPFPRFLSPKTN